MNEYEKNQILKKTNEKLNICDDLSIEKNKNLIFIYCPPKVGSTTIVSSIRLSAFNKCTVLHIHSEQMLKILCNVDNVTINEIIIYNSSLGKNVFVIDIYRTPIEQKISQFFEKLSTYHFNNSPLSINNYDVDRIIKRFNNLFPFISNDEDYYRSMYNIPQLSEFDFERKYILQIINNISYIKLRLKDSNQWGSIISNLLGTEIKIVSDYETDNKPIKEMFQKFKERYRIPNNLLQEIECNKGLLYYFSENEREEYLNNWRNKKTQDWKSYTHEEYVLYNNISSENQYMSEIQRNHYMDTGCTCLACDTKRKQIMNRINNGEKVTDKIIHNNAKREFIANRIKSHPIRIVKRVPVVNKIKEKMQNTFKFK